MKAARFLLRATTCAAVAALAACSSSPSAQQKALPPSENPQTQATLGSSPAAKYVELAGFRITEKSPGNLQVHFGVVNHSDADLGDITLHVELSTTQAKPTDPPVVEFTTKVPSLGPEELKDTVVEVPSKLRPYELPDWQFLKVRFQVTEPK